MGNEKGTHEPVRKAAFARRMRELFPLSEKQLFVLKNIWKKNHFEHLVVSSQQKLTRLQCM